MAEPSEEETLDLLPLWSSQYIISDELHSLYWLYKENFQMCFFCNCNLLTFGRIAIPVKYDKKKINSRNNEHWLELHIYSRLYTWTKFLINIVDCTQCGKGHLLCSLLGANVQVYGEYNTRAHYTTHDKHQYRVSPKVTMEQGYTFTIMNVWVLFYFCRKYI